MTRCSLFRQGTILACFILALASTASSFSQQPLDKAWYDLISEVSTSSQHYQGSDYSSQYLAMPDGVKIAIDLYLPKGLKQGEKSSDRNVGMGSDQANHLIIKRNNGKKGRKNDLKATFGA